MSHEYLRRWGQQVLSYRFDLLDKELDPIGELDVLGESASISNNINRSIKRQLDGVTIPPGSVKDVNFLADRVRPMMIFGNGHEHPLGVFTFTDVSIARDRYGSRQFVSEADSGMAAVELYDQLVLLDVALDIPWLMPPNYRIYDAINDIMNHVASWAPGISWEIPEIDTIIRGNEWFVRLPGVSLLETINDLCAMAGLYSPYADNSGVIQFKLVPATEDDPDINYDDEDVIFSESIVESTDYLAIPNRYIVINSSMTDRPIFGIWDVPAEAPHSIENRGLVVTHIDDLQGIENNAQAEKAARASAIREASALEWVNFSAIPDPYHDTFDLVSWRGNNYREQAWNLQLFSGGVHKHELRRTYYPDAILDEELFEEVPE